LSKNKTKITMRIANLTKMVKLPKTVKKS